MGKEIKEEIIDKNIKYIEERFLKEGFIKKGESYWIKKIKNGIYAIGSKNLRDYIDEKGNLIIDIKTLVDSEFFQKAQVLSGYYFEKDKNNIIHLYELEYNGTLVKDLPPERLLFLVLQLKGKTELPKNKGIKKGREIDKFSEEYFQAWKDIAFFETRILIKSYIKTINEKGLRKDDIGIFNPETNDFIKNRLNLKALTIEDIEFFAKYNMLAKDEKENERLKLKYIKQIIKYLPEMAVDENYYRLGDQLTKEKLETYYKKGYLTKNHYESLLVLFDGVKKKEEKVEEKKKTKEEERIKKINEKLDKIFGGF